MALKAKGDKCRLEVYGPDEDGPARLICNSVVDCPLEHPGEIGLECLRAGSVVPEAGVQPPGPPESAGSRPEASERSPLPQNRTTPGTPKVEPGAGNSEGKSVGVVSGLIPGRSSGPDSHMVVGRDARREEMVQKYVDKLNEISMEMYLESKSSGPPPIPILGPRETEEFLKKLDEFKLTPEQMEFYRDARRRFSPEPSRRKLLKHRRRYAVRKSGGMIRMPGNKPEPPEPEEESLFEVDDEMHGPVVPNVKPQTELEKEVPKPERPEEPEELEEDEDEDVDEGPEQVIEGFETSGDTSLGGYFLGLEVWTDDDGDHTVTLTIDAMSYDIMLPDFMEMLGALNKVKGRLQEILNT